MTQTVTGLFDRFEDAKATVHELERAGVPHGDISLVANDAHGNHAKVAGESAVSQDARQGAGVGALVGGTGGLLASLGLLAIPGIGPVVAAGWLTATLVGAIGGAAVGGVTGGLVGALTDAGVPERDAHIYAEGVRRGGTLVSARVDDSMAVQARSILSRDTAADVSQRGEAYRGEGWSGFDHTASPYSPEQAAAEREQYNRI